MCLQIKATNQVLRTSYNLGILMTSLGSSSSVINAFLNFYAVVERMFIFT